MKLLFKDYCPAYMNLQTGCLKMRFSAFQIVPIVRAMLPAQKRHGNQQGDVA
jgi:hypothetical protein